MSDNEHKVGKGPWEGELPTDARYDQELLLHGDYRNVEDRYRYWTMEAIVADLDSKRHAFHVAVEIFNHNCFNCWYVRQTANFVPVHVISR